ncbi:replication initiation protein [Frankia sp. CNm7]|uniref:Replication initiation protein n=1 Tax=Frankia nepalensis TaxID=1836974 RepID=A0A937ULP0_9ACTN|nr:replication initiation protein [Frankia nepalensis]MBL7514312.1 replication initiation protein [Frankia nepalensis]MBL7517863.1 replication initiation protein [Frankia nepalensis]MBL7628049.1 replication initiation protein [Frankia nepalensis]
MDLATGEIRPAMAPGVVHVRCNNRRASACPDCSRLYQRDARRIVVSGLEAAAGGWAGSGSVAGCPAWFVTLTAPSFGAVHSRRAGKGADSQVCRQRRGTCQHGRALSCHLRHAADDRRLGEPICPRCFDYDRAVVWNALVSALWKATRDALESAVAAAAGLTVAALRRQVRVSFVKVAEVQRRGLVHLHVVIRVDGRDPAGGLTAAPDWASGELVADCLREVVASVAVDAPDPARLARLDASGALPAAPSSEGWAVRWGGQVDIRRIRLGREMDAVKVGNYLAKYLTKSTTDGGALDSPVRSRRHLARLGLRDHARRLVEACWRLGSDPVFTAALDAAAGRPAGRVAGLIRWSHAYGFGGHALTKSRAYSTTFGTLRGVRRRYARVFAAAVAGRPLGVDGGELVTLDEFGRPDGDPATVVVGSWRYAGRGRAPATGDGSAGDSS